MTCAVRADSTVSCWGRDAEGQLGDGGTADSSLPVAILGASGAVSVALAITTTCILKSDGTVSCWGRNSEGQYGNGTTTASMTVPANSPPGWSPVPFSQGQLLNDADGDGCEDP